MVAADNKYVSLNIIISYMIYICAHIYVYIHQTNTVCADYQILYFKSFSNQLTSDIF